MLSIYKFTFFRWASVLIGLLFSFAMNDSLAEPYLAYKTNNPCSACHVNPTGGGMRNSFGVIYGNTILPARSNDSVVDFSDLGNGIGIGGNLRANFEYSSPEIGEDFQGFETESGQIYLSVRPKGSKLSFYIDELVAPNNASSREAFVMYDFDENTYLKFGEMLVPFGIRLQDESAFVRVATQSSFANSDNGLELGLNRNDWHFIFTLNNGTSASNNNDDQFRYSAQGEYLGGPWRIGSGAMINNFDDGDRTVFNVFGGGTAGKFTFLSELAFIEDDTITNVDGDSLGQVAAFAEVNFEAQKGLNLKLSYDMLDQDTDAEESVISRLSGIVEYTPISNFQVRGGVRLTTDDADNSGQETDDVFIQGHVYF